METIDIKVDLCDPIPADYYRHFHLVDESVLRSVLSPTKSVVMFKIIRKNDEKPIWLLMDVINFDEMHNIVKTPPNTPDICKSVVGIRNDIKHMTLCIKNGEYMKKHILNSDKCYLFSMLSNIRLRRMNND